MRCDAGMDIAFLSGIAVIAPDPPAGRRLFLDGLGLPLEHLAEEYWASEKIPGCKHFGVWPLAEAAQACFGAAQWPAGRTVPQASIEFDVTDAEAVQAAAEELRDQGFDVIHEARTEPWGQTVARVQSPEGTLIGISYAPWHHEDAAAG